MRDFSSSATSYTLQGNLQADDTCPSDKHPGGKASSGPEDKVPFVAATS